MMSVVLNLLHFEELLSVDKVSWGPGIIRSVCISFMIRGEE